jgi:hypothetical protein
VIEVLQTEDFDRNQACTRIGSAVADDDQAPIDDARGNDEALDLMLGAHPRCLDGRKVDHGHPAAATVHDAVCACGAELETLKLLRYYQRNVGAPIKFERLARERHAGAPLRLVGAGHIDELQPAFFSQHLKNVSRQHR